MHAVHENKTIPGRTKDTGEKRHSCKYLYRASKLANSKLAKSKLAKSNLGLNGLHYRPHKSHFANVSYRQLCKNAPSRSIAGANID